MEVDAKEVDAVVAPAAAGDEPSRFTKVRAWARQLAQQEGRTPPLVVAGGPAWSSLLPKAPHCRRHLTSLLLTRLSAAYPCTPTHPYRPGGRVPSLAVRSRSGGQLGRDVVLCWRHGHGVTTCLLADPGALSAHGKAPPATNCFRSGRETGRDGTHEGGCARLEGVPLKRQRPHIHPDTPLLCCSR